MLIHLGQPWSAMSTRSSVLHAWITRQLQSFRRLEVWLLIVLVSVFRLHVCLPVGWVVPGVPGCAPAPTAPVWPSFLSLELFVLVRRLLAGWRAAGSRRGMPLSTASRR